MIDMKQAKQAFKEYITRYFEMDDSVEYKIQHTYGVVKWSQMIAEGLQLEKEDIELAKLIALLHDIGRFEQVTKYHNCEDYKNMDHADYGAKILFEEGLIRSFIQDINYDDIIYKAIQNHNKYEIEEGLSKKELLHCKIIRDSDKLENFESKQIQSTTTFLGEVQEEFEQESMTQDVYSCIVSGKSY